jgi:hypothetical protein
MKGTIDGREIVIFDHRTQSGPAYQPSGESVTEHTVAGFRVAADSYCRDRGVLQASDWHIEKIGEWIVVFRLAHLVKPSGIPPFLEEARGWFQTATDPKAYEPTLLATRRS